MKAKIDEETKILPLFYEFLSYTDLLIDASGTNIIEAYKYDVNTKDNQVQDLERVDKTRKKVWSIVRISSPNLMMLLLLTNLLVKKPLLTLKSWLSLRISLEIQRWTNLLVKINAKPFMIF